MFTAALCCEAKGLDPVGKYFLTRFVQCFGAADPEGLGVKAFAERFGLSDRQVTASLAALVACKVMDFSSTSEGKGRPKRCYRLQDDFHKKLSNAAEPPPTHKFAIDNLLEHENRKATHAREKPEKQKTDLTPLADMRGKRQPDRLTVVNRLLLGVLLCRADRFGWSATWALRIREPGGCGRSPPSHRPGSQPSSRAEAQRHGGWRHAGADPGAAPERGSVRSAPAGAQDLAWIGRGERAPGAV